MLRGWSCNRPRCAQVGAKGSLWDTRVSAEVAWGGATDGWTNWSWYSLEVLIVSDAELHGAGAFSLTPGTLNPAMPSEESIRSTIEGPVPTAEG